jgi:hypothetical protein
MGNTCFYITLKGIFSASLSFSLAVLFLEKKIMQFGHWRYGELFNGVQACLIKLVASVLWQNKEVLLAAFLWTNKEEACVYSFPARLLLLPYAIVFVA